MSIDILGVKPTVFVVDFDLRLGKLLDSIELFNSFFPDEPSVDMTDASINDCQDIISIIDEKYDALVKSKYGDNIGLAFIDPVLGSLENDIIGLKEKFGMVSELGR